MKLRELLNIISYTAKKNEIATPYLCGGVVREKVMGSLTKLADLDITNGEASIKNLAKEVELELSKQFSITSKIMLDGHQSIFISKNMKIDFSSNFIIPKIDLELAKLGIKNITGMIREAYSRDFNCNSLIMSFDLRDILDPTKQGIKDIKNKVIRTCLSPEITLGYNKNRIIRTVYLGAKLGFSIDPTIIEFIAGNKNLIADIDPSYLSKTLNKAVSYSVDKTADILDSMELWKSLPIPEALYSQYKARFSKTAQLKKNIDYGEGFYSNLQEEEKNLKKKKKRKRKKIASSEDLYSQLNALRIQFSQAAQEEIDSWEQDEDGLDEELGAGGICDQVSNALAGIVASNIPDCEITDGGQDGDDHAFIIVYNDEKAFAVDIPPRVYEIGSGYSWRKIPSAKIDSADIDIWEINRKDLGIEKSAYYNGADEYLIDNFPIIQNDDLQTSMDRKENDVQEKNIIEDESNHSKDTKKDDKKEDNKEALLEPTPYSPDMFYAMHKTDGLFSMPLSSYPGHLGEEETEGVVNNPYNPIFQSNGLFELKSMEEIADLFKKLSIK